MPLKEIPYESPLGERPTTPDPTNPGSTITIPDCVYGYGQFMWPRVADPRDLPEKNCKDLTDD